MEFRCLGRSRFKVSAVSYGNWVTHGSQVVFSPIAQGVLTGKYQPGQPLPEGSRATDPNGGVFISNLLTDLVGRASPKER